VDLTLSSGEEKSIADTSRDEEFARKLFGDLNRDILGPPGDSKNIVISDSNDEDETHEDVVVNAEAAPPSATNSVDSPTSASDVDKTPDGVSDDNADGGDEAGSPWVLDVISFIRSRNVIRVPFSLSNESESSAQMFQYPAPDFGWNDQVLLGR
jgi:hypothetical protein